MKGRLTQKITIEGVELIDEYTSIYKEHKYNEIYNLYVAVTFFRPFGD